MIFQWLLSTLEIGRAIINIKSELEELKKENQPNTVYKILNLIEVYFLEKNEDKKKKILFLFKEEFIELERNRVFKSAMEQKRMQNIILEISLIYTLISNKISLPSKGEIN